MPELSQELAALLAHLTPQQQHSLLAIVQSAPEQESFDRALAQQPELEAALQGAIVAEWSCIPTDLQTLLEELSWPVESLGEMPRRIELCRQALMAVDKNDNAEQWGALHIKLANSLAQNPMDSRAENLAQAIAHYEQALEVYIRRDYPEQWAATQNNLAIAYRNSIRNERMANLEQAIAHYEQALEVYTRQAYPEDWAMTHNNLACAYHDRFRNGREENLEQAIAHCEQALEVYTRQDYPEGWAETQINLAVSYADRIRGGRAANQEQAIAHFRQALAVYTRHDYPERWATTQINLGNASRERIRGERAENLEQAIAHCEQALEVYTRQDYPENWAMTQNNLGSAYMQRIRCERAENLEQAISHYQQASEVYTRQAYPEQWAMIQNNLGNAYTQRIRGERAENLEQAIAYFVQALEGRLRESNPEQWAATENNLATAYSDRIVGKRAENIDQAIAHYQQALEFYTSQAYPADWAMAQHNLAAAYRDLGQFDQAITHYRQALSVRTLDLFPADFQLTQRSLGRLYFGKSEWAEALAAYREAIRAEQMLLAISYTEVGRRSETEQTAGLYAPAAYALLKLERPGEALVQLEQGKTRLLSRALALDGVDLSLLAATDQEALRSERQTIRELETEMRLPPNTPARRDERELAEALAHARSRLNEAIVRIRVDYPNFMPDGLALAEILALIPKNAVLVAPLVTEQGSAFFVVPGGSTTVSGKQVLWIEDFMDSDLQTMLRGPAQEKEWVGWQGAYFGAQTNPDAWMACIDSTAQVLWDRLIGPLAERLASLDARQVLLMPQGGLGLLPLHAAWREVDGARRYFLDDHTITYLSSAYARRVSQDRLHDAVRQARTLLAVVDPTENLPSTPVEGEQVARLFGDQAAVVLAGSQATLEAVKQQIRERSVNYLHFACHGFYNWRDPMQSGLQLAGEKALTLAQIISEFRLDGTRLVTLSACETGITDIRQSPDEFLGLPAGFLQAGAPAVISTLWAVNDLSTMLLMERFYQLHLHGQELPEALQQAQIWLRNVTAGELARRFAVQGPAQRPFAHPFHWAAFTFSGA